MSELIRIHNMVKSTSVLGPGKRAAIWFQGCLRNCPGCMSPSSRPLAGGHLTTVEKVATAILSLTDIEGVTISGGEPFLQVDALFALISTIKKATNFSVVVYTGYTLDELRKLQNPKVDKLIETGIDILIDGEYVDELNDGVALRGSSNQTVHFLSNRYRDQSDLYTSQKRNAEILVSNRDAFFIGIPKKEMLSTWRRVAEVLDNKKG